MTATSQAVTRPYRILWANVYCLLDTSSGASMAVREILRQLCLRGYEIAICGATVFDHERGRHRIAHELDTFESKRGEVISVQDAPLLHYLYATADPARDKMTSAEENQWMSFYTSTLDNLRPDLVFYYGGQALDMLIADEARLRGIPVAAYLGNANYKGHRWHRDVDLILTDSEATAQLYAEREGYDVTAIGSFIDPLPVVASGHLRQNVLFINPSVEKGAGFVVQLAMLMAQLRPDIHFEVVESRGNWHEVVKSVSTALGSPCDTLPNVTITSNTHDMRPIYQRARVLLAPSLCWESAGRVIAEAMLNGIPALVTNRGGPPEMVGNGGMTISFPEKCYEPPYSHLPAPELAERVAEIIIRLYDDENFYQDLAQKALRVGQQRHSLPANVHRLEQAIAPLLARGAARPGALGGPAMSPHSAAAPDSPAISVIFPVGEREVYLREAIESILVQDFTNFELIIITDGISPAVMSIVTSYLDPRIRLIRLPVRLGISAARNAGLAAARAPLIALMDSDDVALPHRLSRQYAFMQDNPHVTVCSSNAIKLLSDGRRIPMRYPLSDGHIKARLIIVDSSLLNPTTMFRRDFVKSHGISYDPNFRIDEDHRFYAEMMLHGATFEGLPDELLLYRRHQHNFTNNRENADLFKHKVRRAIFPSFFPALNGEELAHLMDAMTIDQPVEIDHQHSMAAIDRAMSEDRSRFDEDRDEIRRILEAYRARLSVTQADNATLAE